MDNNALIPDMPILGSDEAEALDQQVEQSVEKDKEKAEIMMSDGWKQITEILDRHIENFRTGKGLTIDGNTSLEDIGKKFVVASTIAGICEEIKADVINAANGVIQSAGK